MLPSRLRARRPHLVGWAVVVTAVLVLLGSLGLLAQSPSGPGHGAGPEPGATSAPGTPGTGPTTPATSGPATRRPSSPSIAPTRPAPPPEGVPAQLAGWNWQRIPTSRRVVALTFDDGDGRGLTSILDTLAQQRIRATFFLTGEFVAAHPAAARAIVAGGHRVGDHTANHLYLTRMPDAGIRRELADGEAAIRAVTGADPRPLFRFPYGDHDARTIGVVNAAGYVCVGWTVDTRGWMGTSGGVTVAGIVADVVAAAGPGEIVLMHPAAHARDGSTLDADALPGVIAALRNRGYAFDTLDALLR